MRILLVEDDRAVRITVRDALEEAGHQVVDRPDGTAGLASLEQSGFDLLLTDVRLPGVDGISLFHRLRALQPDCAAILMTAFGQVRDAVDVIRAGAQDYISKPFDIDELLLRIDRLTQERLLQCSLARGQPEACDPPGERTRIQGDSPAIQLLRGRVEAATDAGVNVLITGETGTGKELCARMLHCRSARAPRPFINVNCAAIPSELLEAEMFGHERGAFTGAVRQREGRLLAANGGTLFLDEVGELSLEHQAKLLRAIETGTFEPVGSSKVVKVDVWLLSATNRDLLQDVEAGTFRKDLYYRLNVIELAVPPLRKRRGDLSVLVSDFLRELAQRRGISMPTLSPSAMAALVTYDYPGNVRELIHALEHGVALARGGAIGAEHLPYSFRADSCEGNVTSEGVIPLPEAVRQFEQAYIRRVLDQAGGKRSEAAQLLGISRKSLWKKLKETKE